MLNIASPPLLDVDVSVTGLNQQQQSELMRDLEAQGTRPIQHMVDVSQALFNPYGKGTYSLNPQPQVEIPKESSLLGLGIGTLELNAGLDEGNPFQPVAEPPRFRSSGYQPVSPMRKPSPKLNECRKKRGRPRKQETEERRQDEVVSQESRLLTQEAEMAARTGKTDSNAGRPNSQSAPRPASPPPSVPAFGFRAPAPITGEKSYDSKVVPLGLPPQRSPPTGTPQIPHEDPHPPPAP
jgi:hypothetical protein